MRTARDLLAEDSLRSDRAIARMVREQRSSIASGTLKNPTSSLMEALGYPVKSGAVVNAETAMNVSAVFAAVNTLSGLMARLPIRLLRTTDAGFDVLKPAEHPAIPLLTQTPDGFRTAFSWRQAQEAVALTRGNAPTRVIRNKYFEPESLRWMNPGQFEIWSTPEGMPYYRYQNEPLQVWEILNHKDFTIDGIRGIAPVTQMREQIGLAITTQEHGSRHFSNGANPGLVLTAPLNATEAQMTRIREEVNKNHGGVANAGKPFIAYGGLAVSTIQLSNADSQFLESRKFDVEEIARAFRVPKHILQSSEGTTSWGTGLEQLNRAFVDFSLADRLKGLEDEYNLCLLTQVERNKGLFFKFDVSGLVGGSNADRAAYYQIMRNIGAMSINDVRQAEHMNDLPDHIGDVYTTPFNANRQDPAAKPDATAGAAGKTQPENA